MNRSYYDYNAKRFFKQTVNLNMVDIYNEFTDLLIPGANILDMGCGSGRDVLYFKNKGYKIKGVDYSLEMVKLARKYTKEDIILGDFTMLGFENEFDGIWACSSLLHTERERLPHVFERILLYAKKNGIIYVSFKYGEFSGLRNGRYFTDLTEEGLGRVINGKNIKIKKTWKTIDKRHDNSQVWLNALLICNL